jgi:integrase/recombinase XerD
MFDELFKYHSVVSRHREAPCTRERESYLAHRAKDGISPATLRRLARELLVIVREMDLRHAAISLEAIESAAERWARRQRRRGRAGILCWSRGLFVQVAQDWLQFLHRLQKPEGPTVPYAALIQDFTLFLRCERGLSAKTIRNYSWFAECFLDWIHARERSFSGVSVLDVDAFIGQHHCSWSRVTSACCAKSLRAFFRHAERLGWCISGIAAAIETPRIFTQEALPAGPDWESVNSLINSADRECSLDIRDRAILMILSAYGFRSGEVAQLRLGDLDWERERIHVRRSKQRRTQEYPLVYPIGAAILRYLQESRPRTSRREVFLTVKAPFRPLSAGGMYHIVSSRMVRLGIKSVHQGPHALRHACAMHLVAEHFSLKEIGDHLGHRSAFSTRTYAKVDLAALREVATFDLGGLS